MKNRVKLNHIIALYMVESNETGISYELLQKYVAYLQDCFAKNNDNASIVYSSEDLKDLKYGRDDYFTANHFGIESKVSLHQLSKDVVPYMNLDTFLSAYEYTQCFLEQEKAPDSPASSKDKHDGKPL